MLDRTRWIDNIWDEYSVCSEEEKRQFIDFLFTCAIALLRSESTEYKKITVPALFGLITKFAAEEDVLPEEGKLEIQLDPKRIRETKTH